MGRTLENRGNNNNNNNNNNNSNNWKSNGTRFGMEP